MWSVLLLATMLTVTVHRVTADAFTNDPSLLDYDVLGSLGSMMQLFGNTGRSNSLPGSALRGFGAERGNLAYPWLGRAGWTSGGFGNPYGQWPQGRGFGGGFGTGFGNSFGK